MSMIRTIPILVILSLFVSAPLAFAETQVTPAGSNTTQTQVTPSSANTNTGSDITLTNPLSAPDLPTFLNQILGFLIKIGGIVITFMVVYVGFKFVMAQGEPGPLAEAKQMLMWTLIGAAILLGAQAISLAIQQTVQAIS